MNEKIIKYSLVLLIAIITIIFIVLIINSLMVSSLKHKIGNLEAIYVSPKPPSGETGKIIYPTVEETKNKYLNPYINEYGRFYVMLDYFYNWTNFEKRLIINNKFQCD